MLLMGWGILPVFFNDIAKNLYLNGKSLVKPVIFFNLLLAFERQPDISVFENRIDFCNGIQGFGKSKVWRALINGFFNCHWRKSNI
ncbi:hypothetical protein D1872_274180 [compost metagenome]